MITFANLFNPNLKSVITVAKQMDEKMEEFIKSIYEKINTEMVEIVGEEMGTTIKERFTEETMRTIINDSIEIFEDIEEKKKRIAKEEAIRRKELEKKEKEEKKIQKEKERIEMKKQKEREKEEKKIQKEELKKQKQLEKDIEKERKRIEKEVKKLGINMSREEMLKRAKSLFIEEDETEVGEDDLETVVLDTEEEHIINGFDFSSGTLWGKDDNIGEEHKRIFWMNVDVKIINSCHDKLYRSKNSPSLGEAPREMELNIQKQSSVVYEIGTEEVLREYDLDERYKNEKIFVGVLDKETMKIIKEKNICDTVKNWVYKMGLVVPSYEVCRLDFEEEIEREY